MQAEASDLSNQLAMYSADNGDYPATDDWYYDYDDECYGILGDEDFCFESDYSIDYDYEDETGDYWIEIWPTDDEYIGVPPYGIPDDEESDDDTVSVIPKPCKTDTCGGGVIVPPGGGIKDGLPKEETCPTGFIPVPGSARYAQPGFCVMKYEAKIVAGKAVSQPEGVPATSINYDNAELLASQACEGCHVMTNREWMTLARNVISQPDNWVSGRVGNGIMYKGNSGSSIGLLPASSDDYNGYYGLAPNHNEWERRTLMLSNDHIIWDLAGNASESVKGYRSGNGDLFYVNPLSLSCPLSECQLYFWSPLSPVNIPWQYLEPMVPKTASLDISPFPSNLGIESITNDTALEQGLGYYTYHNKNSYLNNSSNIFRRGGSYLNAFYQDGLLSLQFVSSSSSSLISAFRVAK